MIIRSDYSEDCFGIITKERMERTPKVGDTVVVHPHFICDGLDYDSAYTISAVSYRGVAMGYYVTLRGYTRAFPLDALCIASRVELADNDVPIAYVLPTVRSRHHDIKTGDTVCTEFGYHIRGLIDRRTYMVTDIVGNFVKIEGKRGVYPMWGLVKLEQTTKITERNDVEKAINRIIVNSYYGLLSTPTIHRDASCADYDGDVYIQKPILLKPVQKTNSAIASIETSSRDDYSKKEKIPVTKITTTVTLQDGTKGSATCNAGEYDERTGVLNAIANAKCGGNFDLEFDKFCKNREKIARLKCKCGCCGKQYSTQEEAHECRKKHIANKIRKHENYLIRREAKRRLTEEEKEAAIKTAMEKIRKEEK